MLKRFLFNCLAVTFLGGPAFGAHEKDVQNQYRQVSFSDTTTEKKDTVISPIITPIDPKEGFKDLFIPAATSNGISMAQLNPMAISFVQDYIDKYGKEMGDIKISGKPYFDLMDVVLVQHGLPKELKYLAFIESELNMNAKSWAGAVGPWQFMPATARNMGLKVGRSVDERRDIYKSTHAASRYLTSLFSIYGDWLLVIAAYNCGPGVVNSAIKKSGSRDFWQLQRFLPTESRNHVKKFIATHYIMEGEGGVTTLTKTEAGNLLSPTDTSRVIKDQLADARLQYVSGRYNSVVIIRSLGMDMPTFTKLNPDFDKLIALNGNYGLYLPNDKMDMFLSKKLDILRESVHLLLYPQATASKSPARQ